LVFCFWSDNCPCFVNCRNLRSLYETEIQCQLKVASSNVLLHAFNCYGAPIIKFGEQDLLNLELLAWWRMRVICAVFPLCILLWFDSCVSIQFNTCIFFNILWFLGYYYSLWLPCNFVVCNIVSKLMKIHQEAATSCCQFMVSFFFIVFHQTNLFEPSRCCLETDVYPCFRRNLTGDLECNRCFVRVKVFY